MFVKLNFPTVIHGLGNCAPGQILGLSGAEAIPLIKTGAAVPRYGLGAAKQKDDDLERLKEKARQAGQNVDWAEQERFKRKPHARVVATNFQAEETFGEKLRRAVERRAAQRGDSCKQVKEHAEKERSRYRKPVRRQRTKGE